MKNITPELCHFVRTHFDEILRQCMHGQTYVACGGGETRGHMHKIFLTMVAKRGLLIC
jgi:hypothetical protein